MVENRSPLIVLLERMDDLLQEMNPIEIEIQEKKVEEFYEITQNTEAHYYREQKTVSPEYFITLLAPFATKVFLKVATMENLPKVMGVIHTESEVNYLKPLSFGTYHLACRMETLQKKKGRMGHYLSMTFRISLFNHRDEEVANDIHQFFFRLKPEGD